MQDFKDDKSKSYIRANDNWVCGQARLGCPCRRGPGPDGSCGAARQCEPVLRNSRWYCTRPSELGGPCLSGPGTDGICCNLEPDCVPVRSLLSSRRRLSIYLSVLVLAIGILAFGGGYSHRIVDPGPLNPAHAAITECADCHNDSGKAPFSAWIGLATAKKDASFTIRHNNACLACHEAGRLPHFAHGRRFHDLETIANSYQANGLDSKRELQGKIIACSTCHKEHRSERHLADIENNTCNSCHRQTVAGFPGDHPPLGQFPYYRQRGIAFDHERHFNRHFLDQPDVAPASCLSCHQPARDGLRMGVTGFEACASCHLDDVEGRSLIAGTRGLAMLQLPGLDMDTLAKQGITVGEWPQWAEAALNPGWSLLLDAAGMSGPSTEVFSIVDTLDLREASPGQLQQLSDLSWQIKHFFHRLKLEGPEAVLGENRALIRSLSQRELELAINDWFPSLDSEIQAWQMGAPPTALAIVSGKTSQKDATSKETNSEESNSEAVASDLDEIGSGLFDDADDSDEDLSDLFGEDAGLDDEGDLDSLFDTGSDDIEDAGEIPASVEESRLDAESWAASGAWYRRDFSLFYRPSGHNDPIVKEWWNRAAETEQTTELFHALSGEGSAGRCGKCHINTDTNDGGHRIHWLSTTAKEAAAPFTPFSHRTHFNIDMSEGCASCHKMSDAGSVNTGRGDVDNFVPMSLEQCGSCHAADQEISDCQTCHRYHPQPRGEKRLPAELENFLSNMEPDEHAGSLAQ